MRKIPLGFAAAILSSALLAMAAAPAGAAVADCKKKDQQSSTSSKRHSTRPASDDKSGSSSNGSDIKPVAAHPCATDDKTVHHDAVTHTEYRYWKVAQVWKSSDHPQASQSSVPGDDVATWDYSKAAVIYGQTYVTQWYDKPQTSVYYAAAHATEGVDKPFWMGPVQGSDYTGWYTYHLKDTRTVTDKAASDEVIKGKPTACASPSAAAPAKSDKAPAAPKSSDAALQPVDDQSPSAAASAAVPTSIDAGLAGAHAKDSKAPAMWPVYAVAGAAIIVLGLIIVMRRRAAARG